MDQRGSWDMVVKLLVGDGVIINVPSNKVLFCSGPSNWSSFGKILSDAPLVSKVPIRGS